MISSGYYQDAFAKDDEDINNIIDGSSEEDDEIDIVKEAGVDGISLLLNSYGPDAEKLSEALRKHGATYENLAGITGADLEVLGLKNKKTEQELLTVFANLPNQAPHYESVIQNLYAKNYTNHVLDNISGHLENLKMSLMAAEIKFNMSVPEDILLNDRLYTSDIVLKTIDMMLADVQHIEHTLMEIKNLDHNANKAPVRHGRAWWLKTIGSTLLASSVAASSFLLYKYMKQR